MKIFSGGFGKCLCSRLLTETCIIWNSRDEIKKKLFYYMKYGPVLYELCITFVRNSVYYMCVSHVLVYMNCVSRLLVVHELRITLVSGI